MDITSILNLGLFENTSKTQIKNGTRSFYDPQTKASYQIHSNGYLRRTVFYTLTQTFSNGQPNKHFKWARNYQLNPHITKDYRTTRILVQDPEKQVKIICDRIISFRNYRQSPKSKYHQADKFSHH